ncbi:MAG: hypothetical protein IJP78_03945 [Clostridia bacterium]|nr:hypothetical protein [Clostridia bacterium]
MKRQFVSVLLLCLVVLVPVAGAVTDYLSSYSSWVSAEAAQSAREYTPPVALSDRELSIFRLGYACGYDSAKSVEELWSFLPDGLGVLQTRAALEPEEGQEVFIINTETNKFHRVGCSAEKKILPEHRKEIVATFESVCGLGYSPCGICLKNNQ